MGHIIFSLEGEFMSASGPTTVAPNGTRAITQADVIDTFMDKNDALVQRGRHERLHSKEVAQLLSTLLFEVSKAFPDDGLVRVRDFNEIGQKGPFKYAGQLVTMKKEGLIPDDVFAGLVTVQLGRAKPGEESHVGPSYLKVKSLLTNWRVREFAARQVAYAIFEHLIEHPPQNRTGYVVAIPNMTGGAFIGDEIGKQLSQLINEAAARVNGLGSLPHMSGANTGTSKYDTASLGTIAALKVWAATPYMRAMRKETEVQATKPQLNSLVEGSIPAPAQTAVIMVIEELRTASETTSNAARTYLDYGYTPENGVGLLDVSFFDYRHPVGVARMQKMNIPAIYVVPGIEMFDAARKDDYISVMQHSTVSSWLRDPWEFTRRILPGMIKQKEQAEKEAEKLKRG